DSYIDTRLRYWQLFLYPAAKIEEVDIYDIEKWTDEWLILLAYCITYDIYIRILSGAFIAQFGGSEEEDGGSSEGSGAIKKIVTGPTEVEYHNNADALASFLKNFTGPDGIL